MFCSLWGREVIFMSAGCSFCSHTGHSLQVSKFTSVDGLVHLEEETNNLASEMSLLRVVLIHDALAGGQHDMAELP